MSACRVSASWVLRIDGAPIRDGAVLVDHDGRIVLIGPADAVPSPPGIAAHHFEGAALLPGLVNTHTHLELTGLAGQVDDDDFPSWIRHLRARKAERSRGEVRAAAEQGVRDGFAAGITTVADTGDSGLVIEALATQGGSGVCYQEVFGPDPAQCAASIAGLGAVLDDLEQFRSVRRRLGVSPHSPYTVSGALYQATMALAAERRLPVAGHVAESASESALLETATGPFAEQWIARGIPLPAMPGRSPVTWLDRHGVLTPRTLCIHAVRVNVEDIARLALSGAAVAVCPRSNRRHGHGDAPLSALLAAGVRVGLGTDSVVSVGNLDLFAEARLAREIGGINADRALALVTLDAARAIGLADEVGHLGRGCWGDMTVVRVGATESPVETVLAGGLDSVVATFVAGREVFRAT
jgi:5-methylthioadenosine/S-adenosylhomocysteine deaminase